MVVYAPGTLEKDQQKQNMALQQHASLLDTNSAAITALQVIGTTVSNSLSVDVALTDNAYHDGPSCAQGTTGTWLAIGSVTVLDASAAASFSVKLWDGTTVKDSGAAYTALAGVYNDFPLMGVFVNPAGNIKVSVSDSNGTPNGKIIANATGNGKDSTLTVVRIA